MPTAGLEPTKSPIPEAGPIVSDDSAAQPTENPSQPLPAATALKRDDGLTGEETDALKKLRQLGLSYKVARRMLLARAGARVLNTTITASVNMVCCANTQVQLERTIAHARKCAENPDFPANVRAMWSGMVAQNSVALVRVMAANLDNAKALDNPNEPDKVILKQTNNYMMGPGGFPPVEGEEPTANNGNAIPVTAVVTTPGG